ncbi:MAG: 2,3-diaminopropionate biosynthesis protein SbnB, partial [Pseudonocardia sp.]
MFDFYVVPGVAVADILARSRKRVIDVTRDAYVVHERGGTINPDSYFLRFPEKPSSRVIALPAYLGENIDRIGIKWIASFPDNVSRG